MNKYLFFIVWQIVFAVGIANAQSINILSLNNSLIDYNNQPMMFNEMVKMMGKDAQWNARTQLGRTFIMILFPAVWRCLEIGITLFCKNKVPFLKTILKF